MAHWWCVCLSFLVFGWVRVYVALMLFHIETVSSVLISLFSRKVDADPTTEIFIRVVYFFVCQNFLIFSREDFQLKCFDYIWEPKLDLISKRNYFLIKIVPKKKTNYRQIHQFYYQSKKDFLCEWKWSSFTSNFKQWFSVPVWNILISNNKNIFRFQISSKWNKQIKKNKTNNIYANTLIIVILD